MAVKIYIIESLGANDRLTGKEIYEDLLRWESERNYDIYTSFENVTSKEKFISHTNKIFLDLNKDDEVIFQLEMHGDGDKSGIFLSNGELILWKELLPIFSNVKSKCNVFHLFMATCFGNYVGKLLLNGNFPFDSFTGTEFEISENQIIEDYSQIYSYFFQEKDLYKAIEKIESLGIYAQVKTKDSQTLIGVVLNHTLETFGNLLPLEELSLLITKLFGIDFGRKITNPHQNITNHKFYEIITDFFQKNVK